jgi:hypothetical protein
LRCKTPLPEILRTLTRLNKLTAARSIYGSRGLLGFDVFEDARRRAAGLPVQGLNPLSVNLEDGLSSGRRTVQLNIADAADVDGEFELLSVQLSSTMGKVLVSLLLSNYSAINTYIQITQGK